MVTGMPRILALVSRKYLSVERSRSAAICRISRELGPWSDSAAVVSETSSILTSSPDAFKCSQRSVGSADVMRDRKSTRLNSSHLVISYAVFCLKKKKEESTQRPSYNHV